MTKKNKTSTRLLNFSVEITKFMRLLPNKPEYNVIKYQRIKSATSAGANYEEAQAGSSRADFNNKVRISLREMRESNYWLRIIKSVLITANKKELDHLLKESLELQNILGSILVKTTR